MAVRNTQTKAEAYSSGGETFRNTQTVSEVYSSGGETFHNTQTVVEVYCTVAASGGGTTARRDRIFGIIGG